MDPRKSCDLQVRHRKAEQILQKFKKLQNVQAQKLLAFQTSLENIHHNAQVQTPQNLISVSHDFTENTPLNTLISDFIIELSENQNGIIKNQAFTKYLRRTSRLTQIETHIDSLEVVKIPFADGSGALDSCKLIFESTNLKSGQVLTNFKDSWRKLANFLTQENVSLTKSSENRENCKNFESYGHETTMIPSNKNMHSDSVVLPSGDVSSLAEPESETLVQEVSVVDSSPLNLEKLVLHKVDFTELKFYAKNKDLPDSILVPDGQFYYKPSITPFSDSRGALTRCSNQDFTKSKADFLQKLKSVAPVKSKQLDKLNTFFHDEEITSDKLFSRFYELTITKFHAHEKSFLIFGKLDSLANLDSLASVIHKNLEVVKIDLFDQIETITHQKNQEIRNLLENLDSLKIQYDSSCKLLHELCDLIVKTVKIVESFVIEVDELRKPVLGRGEQIQFTNTETENSNSKLALTVYSTILEQYNPALEKINYKENLSKVMFTNGLKSQLERKLQNNLQK